MVIALSYKIKFTVCNPRSIFIFMKKMEISLLSYLGSSTYIDGKAGDSLGLTRKKVS